MTANPQGMACPNDGAPLVMSERQGIEIDYCPSCRGVWLDRGELDKIIERSGAHPAPAYQRAAPAAHDPRRYEQQGHGKRRKSFLEDLFD